MDELVLMDLARATLLTALMLVTPALLTGMFVGLSVSLFQTITSLQEQTMAIVPKMMAVVALLLLLLPWIMATLRDFTQTLFENLAEFGSPGV
jgi:flagellar biosynthetic protein FliQ